MISKVEYIFIYLFTTCISSLKYSYPTWSFDYFQQDCFLFFFFFFAIEFAFGSSLYILSINPLSDIVCKYFLPYNRLSYNSVDYFFCCEEALRLEQSLLFIFGFGACALGVISKILSRPMSRSYYPFVSFQKLMVSGLTFKSLVNFGVNFHGDLPLLATLSIIFISSEGFIKITSDQLGFS